MAAHVTCPLCNGTLQALKGQTLEQVEEIHRTSCPSPLAASAKSKRLK